MDIKQKIEEFCLLASRSDRRLKPFCGSSPKYFEARNHQEKVQVLQNFDRYLNVFKEIEREGKKINDDKVVLWRMLARLGLIPQEDIFDKLDKSDVIEIYDKQSIQLYRNLNFFDLVSYSLDDILNRPWWDLYERDPKVTEKLFEIGAGVLSGRTPYTVNVAKIVPKHLVVDIGSEDPLQTLSQTKYFSPLKSKENTIEGFIHVFSVERFA